MSKSICFLLGAGCEGNGQLGLPSGKSFKRDIIVAKDVAKLIYAINKKTQPHIKNGTIIAHNSSSILYQTILEHGIDSFAFSDEDKSTIDAYIKLNLDNNEIKKDEKERIRNGFVSIYREQFYNAIKDLEKETKDLDDNVLFFLENACFYSFVDSLFNYLRKPEKYQNEVNRIIKLYYAAYLSIILKLFNDTERSSFEKIIESGASISENRCAIAELVRSAQIRICNDKKKYDCLYYNIIRKYICDHKDREIEIVTTNYTDFSESLTGIDKNKIAFIHGRLSLFESTKTKQTEFIDAFSEDELIFPFIFVQSGVKPIVNAVQIHEFEKAAKMIESADELCILGYGVNSDDEHISNLLRERIRCNKKITYFMYEKTSEKQSAVESELQCDGMIRFEDATNFENVLKSF